MRLASVNRISIFLLIIFGVSSFLPIQANESPIILIYSDLDYPTAWWGHDYGLLYKQYLTDTFEYFGIEYMVVNATDLAEYIQFFDPENTVLIPTQDVLPDTVWDGKDNSIIEKWLKSGGTLVWTGDQEFYHVGHSETTSTWGDSSYIYGLDINLGGDISVISTILGDSILPSFSNSEGFVSLIPVSLRKLSGKKYEIYGEGEIQGHIGVDPLTIFIGKGSIAKLGMTGGELTVPYRGAMVCEYVLNKKFGMNISISEKTEFKKVDPLIIGEYHNWYSGPPRWIHWGENNHNVDTIKDNGFRDIASANYPIIGPYDSNSREVIEYHIELAQAAGIDAFAVDWYGKNSYEDESIHLMLEVAKENGFKVALEYEPKVHFEWMPHSTRVQAINAIQDEIEYLFTEYSSHEAYLNYFGKPVVFIFATGYLTVDEWNQLFSNMEEKGYDAVYIGDITDIGYYSAFDGLYEWINLEPPGSQSPAKRLSYINDYFLESSLYYPGKFYGSGVWPGFDDSGVEGWGGGTRQYPRSNGENYREMWEVVLENNPQFIMIMTFNDWNEGTEIEPSVEDGFDYLQKTAEYVFKLKNQTKSFEYSPGSVVTKIEKDDQYYVNRDSSLSLAFSWFNGEPVFGEVYIDGKIIQTDNIGEISLDISSESVEEKNIKIEHISVSGIEHISDVSEIDVVIDRLEVTAISSSTEQSTVGNPISIWCTVEYELGSNTFSEDNGVVYLNDQQMTWNNDLMRWEVSAVEDNSKEVSYSVSQIKDLNGIELPINEDNPSITVEWASKGIPGFPTLSVLVGFVCIYLIHAYFKTR